MKILLNLSIESIKKYIREAIMVIISIALTVSMMMMVAITMGSIYQTFASQVESGKNYNVSMHNVKNVPKLLDALNRSDIAYYTLSGDIPYYQLDERNYITPSNFFKYKLEENDERLNTQTIIEGRLPHQNNEITIPKTSTLKIGDKIQAQDSLSEEWENFEVVGKTQSENLYEYYISEDEMIDEEGSGFSMNILFVEGTKNIDKLMKSIGYDSSIFHKEAMVILNHDYNFVMGYQKTPGPMLYAFMIATIIMLVIVGAATFTLIMNSFDAFLSTKMMTLSTLRSVGATKSQIKMMILFEGLVLASFGLLFGMTIGYFISKALLGFLTIKVIEIASTLEDNFKFTMNFWAPLWSYILVLISGYLTIYFVLRSKIKTLFTLEVVETSQSLNIKKNKTQTTLKPKVMKDIAYINTNTLKDYKGIQIALTIIIILLISINGWVTILLSTTESTTEKFDTNITGLKEHEDVDLLEANHKILDKLNNYSDIHDVFVFYETGNLEINDVKENHQQSISLHVLDDEVFKKFLKEERLKTQSEIILVHDDTYLLEDEHVLLSEDHSLILNKEDTITIDETVDSVSTNFESILYGRDVILLSESRYRKTLNHIPIVRSNIKLESDLDIKALDSISSSLDEAFYLSSQYYESYADRMIRNMVTSITSFVFIYIGFVILINIVNISISNYRKRKKDIAMIRSMGATQKQIDKLMLWESIYIVIKPLVLGIVLGNILTLGVISLINLLVEGLSVSFQFDLLSMFISLTLVVLIILTQIFALSIESKKSDIISDIRAY